jgi:hypothetical protein
MAKFKILKFPAKCPFPEKSSLVMHGSQLLLLEAAYRYTYTRVTLVSVPFQPVFHLFKRGKYLFQRNTVHMT